MPLFPVSPEKEQALFERMRLLGINESDLDERFIRGSGAGGQKINKTSVCVVITHLPTGISVRCQRERSQSLNRFLARRELCERIAAKQAGVTLAHAADISKLRRQKARRSRRNKQKLVDGKRGRSKTKALRRSPGMGE